MGSHRRGSAPQRLGRLHKWRRKRFCLLGTGNAMRDDTTRPWRRDDASSGDRGGLHAPVEGRAAKAAIHLATGLCSRTFDDAGSAEEGSNMQDMRLSPQPARQWEVLQEKEGEVTFPEAKLRRRLRRRLTAAAKASKRQRRWIRARQASTTQVPELDAKLLHPYSIELPEGPQQGRVLGFQQEGKGMQGPTLRAHS